MKKRTPQTVAERIVSQQRLLERAKKLYRSADELLETLFPEMKVGQEVELPDGRKATFVDNFAKGNVAFGHGAVRRFDLKVK